MRRKGRRRNKKKAGSWKRYLLGGWKELEGEMRNGHDHYTLHTCLKFSKNKQSPAWMEELIYKLIVNTEHGK